MLWYLANGSLNDYLKSQIAIQGQYYTGQSSSVAYADFSPATNTATFKQLKVENLAFAKAHHVLSIDHVEVELAKTQNQALLTRINRLSINTLTINIEQGDNKITNVEQLVEQITLKLALDYPEFYPAIAAKVYAQHNPEMNAEEYAKKNPQVGPIIAHTKAKKKRGKAQAKILVELLTINTLALQFASDGSTKSINKQDIRIDAFKNGQGLVANQLGGEILLHLLNLAIH